MLYSFLHKATRYALSNAPYAWRIFLDWRSACYLFKSCKTRVSLVGSLWHLICYAAATSLERNTEIPLPCMHRTTAASRMRMLVIESFELHMHTNEMKTSSPFALLTVTRTFQKSGELAAQSLWDKDLFSFSPLILTIPDDRQETFYFHLVS